MYRNFVGLLRIYVGIYLNNVGLNSFYIGQSGKNNSQHRKNIGFY